MWASNPGNPSSGPRALPTFQALAQGPNPPQTGSWRSRHRAGPQGRLGGAAGRSRVPQHLEGSRAPETVGEEAARRPRGGSPPPVQPLPPPGGVEESPDSSSWDLHFSGRAVHQPGSAPWDPSWGLAEVQVMCMRTCLQVCVRINSCVCASMRMCTHVYACLVGTLMCVFA